MRTTRSAWTRIDLTELMHSHIQLREKEELINCGGVSSHTRPERAAFPFRPMGNGRRDWFAIYHLCELISLGLTLAVGVALADSRRWLPDHQPTRQDDDRRAAAL